MSNLGLSPEYSKWTPEEREPGWFGRLVTPPGGGRPATAAFLVGILGAVAFVASLSLDWQSVTEPPDTPPSSDTQPLTAADNITNPFMLGLVYALCGVALLGLLGAALTRPELALRLRMAAAGVTVALVGVLVATTIRLPEQLMTQYAIEPAVARTSYEPGLFCAYAAVVLPVVAIWLAARPAARALLAEASAAAERSAAGGEARHAAGIADPVDVPGSWHRPGHTDGAHGLIVSPSEPLDLSVSPDQR